MTYYHPRDTEESKLNILFYYTKNYTVRCLILCDTVLKDANKLVGVLFPKDGEAVNTE